jgi:hypothetical protein
MFAIRLRQRWLHLELLALVSCKSLTPVQLSRPTSPESGQQVSNLVGADCGGNHDVEFAR